MRPKEKILDPVTVDADGLAELQTVLSATTLVLDGGLISDGVFTADLARRLSITSSGDDSGITFTIAGTSPEGVAQTEDITGGNVATVTTVKYWATATSITTSGAAAANVSVGTVDEFVSPIIPLNHYAEHGATISLENFVGTIDVSIELTFSKIQETDDIVFFAGPAGLTNETANAYADINAHATGVRLVCNSYTSGASLAMIVNQDRVGC